MIFRTFQIENVESDFSYNTLLSYLSQITLTMIDEEAGKKHKTLEDIKVNYKEKESLLEKEKEVFSKLSSELSRQKAVSRNLSLIQTLISEGVLVGQNRNKVKEVLKTINKKDFKFLRDLEERLSLYLPDTR